MAVASAGLYANYLHYLQTENYGSTLSLSSFCRLDTLFDTQATALKHVKQFRWHQH